MFRRLKAAIDAFYDRIMPAAWLRMKPRYQWAFGILIVATLWIGSSVILHPKTQISTESAEAKPASDVPSVRVAALTASARNATVTVRGRTQALHAVDVRAEIEGVVKAIHFEKGQKVRKGDVLCEIDINDRGAKVAQMNAMVAQTSKELEVAQELFKQGFRSKTQLAQAQAAYEAAKAGASTMGIQLANTKIRAPFDGYVDDRYVDVGDYMRAGDKCEMVYAPEPFLAVGAVSEHEVGQITIGDPASATLVTGETVNGKVRFVADRADSTTRTFRIEVELPNARQHVARRRQCRHPHPGQARCGVSHLARHPRAGRCRRGRRPRGRKRAWCAFGPSRSFPMDPTACGSRACPSTWTSSPSARNS